LWFQGLLSAVILRLQEILSSILWCQGAFPWAFCCLVVLLRISFAVDVGFKVFFLLDFCRDFMVSSHSLRRWILLLKTLTLFGRFVNLSNSIFGGNSFIGNLDFSGKDFLVFMELYIH